MTVAEVLRRCSLTRSQREAWASWDDDAWAPFVDAWFARGFRLPPTGDPGDDPDTSLRSRLWPIADARPDDLGRWVRDAKCGSAYQIVGYVFAQWRGLLNDTPDDDWATFDATKRLTRDDERHAAVRVLDILRGDQ